MRALYYTTTINYKRKIKMEKMKVENRTYQQEKTQGRTTNRVEKRMNNGKHKNDKLLRPKGLVSLTTLSILELGYTLSQDQTP